MKLSQKWCLKPERGRWAQHLCEGCLGHEWQKATTHARSLQQPSGTMCGAWTRMMAELRGAQGIYKWRWGGRLQRSSPHSKAWSHLKLFDDAQADLRDTAGLVPGPEIKHASQQSASEQHFGFPVPIKATSAWVPTAMPSKGKVWARFCSWKLHFVDGFCYLWGYRCKRKGEYWRTFLIQTKLTMER